MIIVCDIRIMSSHPRCSENTNFKTLRFSMNDDAELYRKGNSIMKQDTINALNEYSPRFKWKETNENILDIGFADGGTTDILRKYLPMTTEMLMACDINVKSVDYATKHYGNNKTVFTILDIEGDIPDELKENFDHVFSFYTLQWITNQRKCFENIYDLMTSDGECFLVFVAYSLLYSVFGALKDTPKWKTWLTEFDKFISPYHHCADPDRVVEKMLQNIGFKYIDVKSRQKWVRNNITDFRNLAAAVNPFKIPEHLQQEFLDDLINVGEELRFIDKKTNTVTLIYNLLYVHCRK